jgi:cytochrome oxidase Cu insertion factor (SCO1/SenC/PrrC family)
MDLGERVVGLRKGGDEAGSRSPLRSRTLLAGVVALLVGLGGTVGVSRLLSHAAAAPATVKGTVEYLPAIVAAPRPAPDISLNDQSGQPVSLASLRGQVVVVTFMDPQCQTLCPINAQDLSVAEADLAPTVKPVLLVVSVAPDRTATDVSTFVSHVTWRPGWHWLLGNQAQLQAVWAAWSLALDGTDVVHQEIAHVIDRQGRIVASYNAPYSPADLAATITTEWAKPS